MKVRTPQKQTVTPEVMDKRCEVALHKVSRWIEPGRLQGFEFPGGGDGRVVDALNF